MQRHPVIYRHLLITLLALLVGRAAFAHGGEDHGAASALPVPNGGAAAGMLTSYGVTNIFEVVVRYPPPTPGKPTPFRFLISDYATNEPITGARFTLTSSPSGLILDTVLKMISPGIYAVDLRLPADTVYSLVMTLEAGNRTDLIEIKNVYAGDHAEKFLAEHSGGAVGENPSAARSQQSGVPGWIWWGCGLLLLVAGGWFVLQRRGRRGVKNSDGTAAQEKRSSDRQ